MKKKDLKNKIDNAIMNIINLRDECMTYEIINGDVEKWYEVNNNNPLLFNEIINKLQKIKI